MEPAFIVPPCAENPVILHQDARFLVVSKPAGLLSVPGRHPANRDCLIARLQKEFPGALTVHRLDMDTSGIMLVALDKATQRYLAGLLEQRRVDKHYVARVEGLLEKNSGVIDLPMRCDWPNRPLQVIDVDQGKSALTRYEVISRCTRTRRTRVGLSPVTGRSHQLRLHMAAIGHPILGCRFYAPEPVTAASGRLLLHAERLGFAHPSTGLKVSYSAPAPF